MLNMIFKKAKLVMFCREVFDEFLSYDLRRTAEGDLLWYKFTFQPLYLAGAFPAVYASLLHNLFTLLL